jgi:hypothetical protein
MALIFVALCVGAGLGAVGGLWLGRQHALAEYKAEVMRMWRSIEQIDETIAMLEAQRDALRFPKKARAA